jgi:hypothetical protein
VRQKEHSLKKAGGLVVSPRYDDGKEKRKQEGDKGTPEEDIDVVTQTPAYYRICNELAVVVEPDELTV